MNKSKRKTKIFPRRLKRIDIALISFGILAAGRLLWTFAVYSIRQPLAILGIPSAFCLLAIIVFFSLFYLYKVTRSDGHTFTVTIGIFAIAFMVTLIVPMPPKPWLPEAVYFLEHRSDYESVVELAKNGGLEHGANCGYLLPDEYAHVAIQGCISVDNNGNDGLRIMFNLQESFSSPLVYSERDPAKGPCGLFLSVEQQIDTDWFICLHIMR